MIKTVLPCKVLVKIIVEPGKVVCAVETIVEAASVWVCIRADCVCVIVEANSVEMTVLRCVVVSRSSEMVLVKMSVLAPCVVVIKSVEAAWVDVSRIVLVSTRVLAPCVDVIKTVDAACVDVSRIVLVRISVLSPCVVIIKIVEAGAVVAIVTD